jgi:hypothetical protein
MVDRVDANHLRGALLRNTCMFRCDQMHANFIAPMYHGAVILFPVSGLP